MAINIVDRTILGRQVHVYDVSRGTEPPHLQYVQSWVAERKFFVTPRLRGAVSEINSDEFVVHLSIPEHRGVAGGSTVPNPSKAQVYQLLDRCLEGVSPDVSPEKEEAWIEWVASIRDAVTQGQVQSALELAESSPYESAELPAWLLRDLAATQHQFVRAVAPFLDQDRLTAALRAVEAMSSVIEQAIHESGLSHADERTLESIRTIINAELRKPLPNSVVIEIQIVDATRILGPILDEAATSKNRVLEYGGTEELGSTVQNQVAALYSAMQNHDPALQESLDQFVPVAIKLGQSLEPLKIRLSAGQKGRQDGWRKLNENLVMKGVPTALVMAANYISMLLGGPSFIAAVVRLFVAITQAVL
jgi:hypothetical protein